jgi:ribosomal protein S18 acetylase RimI-like enzyme
MLITKITNKNSKLLEIFIKQNLPQKFRYYDSRGIEVIKNHKLTIIGTIGNVPIAYGHIDYENGVNWVGLCVLDKFQGKGYGKKIFSYLLDYVHTNNIKHIQLTVDIDNYRAFNLYLKHNFQIADIKNKHYIMKYNSSIELPVSMGEALDKLTILEIKMKKITDARRADVEKEFNLLSSKLEKYKEEYIFYYNILLSINESIWDMQDLFRNSKNPQEQNKLCIKIIKENDNRFRVKKKINNLSNSSLKEQKGYKPKTAFVLTHLGLGDNITAIGAVRYLSTCYDKVLVVCKGKYKKNMELFYEDDETIELYPVMDDNCISPRRGFSYEVFKKITENMDLFLVGCHCITKKANSYIDLPFNFYRDMNINEKFFWTYFHVNIPSESKSLFNKLKDVSNYIFIHNSASTGNAFSIVDIENKLKFNKQEILVINPNNNIYNKVDPFFELANEFLNHPLAFYIDVIINATKIIMTDSSFFCLSLNLPIKTNELYLKSRDNRDYSHFYKKEYYNTKLNKKIFKTLK